MVKENEVVGPRLWMFRVDDKSKWHITGGYGQPDHKKTLCGRRTIDAKNIVYDPRDIVPYVGMTNMNQYCKECLNMMVYESLSEQIIFCQIQLPTGETFGEHSIKRYLTRKEPLELNNAPPLKDANCATAGNVAGDPPPKRYKYTLKSTIEAKRRKKDRN